MVMGEAPVWVLKSWNCTFDLSDKTTTFGKEDSDCLIPFRSVSKHHAVINWDPNKGLYKIKEAPFSLGTFVNDTRIGGRAIILTLGDTIRFGADSPTFRLEIKEKEKDYSSPRKTLSTVHDMEQADNEDWPEQTSHQTIDSNKPFLTGTITPLRPVKLDVPAPKITNSEPPDLRSSPILMSPIMRAEMSSRSSQEDRSRTSTPNSVSRQNSSVSEQRLEQRIHRNKGPKGSALYGQPTWWGENEPANDQRPHSPRRSASTEYDPFEHERHDWVSGSRSDLRDRPDYHRERSERHSSSERNGDRNGDRNGYTPIGQRSNGNGNGYVERWNEKNDRNHYDDDRSERSYDNRSHSRRRSMSPPPHNDNRSHRSTNSPSSRHSRIEEHVYTPPPQPVKEAMAFQITFDDPKPVTPRGKKKKSSPPKSDNERSRNSIGSAGSRGSEKSDRSIRSCSKDDIQIDDIELCEEDIGGSNLDMGLASDNSPSEMSTGSAQPKEDPPIKRELTQWANTILRKREYVPVFCIHSALQDGRTLPQLIHCIADEKVSDLNKDPKMRIEILPNVVKCLKFCTANNLITGELSAADIVKGNEHIITILLEQLRAAEKRKQERPEIPAADKEKEASDAELTDDESVLPFRRHKTMAAPPRSKRMSPNTSHEEGDKAKAAATEPLQIMLLQTLNDLTQQLKLKVDKSAVYSLHIKEELDSMSGSNSPDDITTSLFDNPPKPGSDISSLPDSEITQALKNLRFVERKLAEIEENLVHVRNESIPGLPKKDTDKKKKKKGAKEEKAAKKKSEREKKNKEQKGGKKEKKENKNEKKEKRVKFVDEAAKPEEVDDEKKKEKSPKKKKKFGLPKFFSSSV